MQGFNMGRYRPPEDDENATGRRKKARASTPTIVRFPMPFSAWCLHCEQAATRARGRTQGETIEERKLDELNSSAREQGGVLLAKGERFNAEKIRVGQYLTSPIWQFRFTHGRCGGTIVIQTDPQHTRYVCIAGAQGRAVDQGPLSAESVANSGSDVGDVHPLEAALPAADRQSRQDAFARLEQSIVQRQQVVRLETATDADTSATVEPRLDVVVDEDDDHHEERPSGVRRMEALQAVADRQWADGYAWNSKLRDRHRAERRRLARDRARLAAQFGGDRLGGMLVHDSKLDDGHEPWAGGVGQETKALEIAPETEEDRLRASVVEFGSVPDDAPEDSRDRLESLRTLSKASFFSSPSPSQPQPHAPSTRAAQKLEETRHRLLSSVAATHRLQHDPFLVSAASSSPSSPSWFAQKDIVRRGARQALGVKRKRPDPSDELLNQRQNKTSEGLLSTDSPPTPSDSHGRGSLPCSTDTHSPGRIALVADYSSD